MKVAFSSMPAKEVSKVLELGHDCFLLSFGVKPKEGPKYIKLFNEYPDREIYFFLDSGAYSVVNSGRSVRLEDYAENIQNLKDMAGPHIKILPFNLDVIPLRNDRRTPEQMFKESMDNYFKLLEYGHATIQTLHYFDPYEFWYEIIKQCTHLGWYALGGATKVDVNLKKKWLYRAVSDLPAGANIHILGCTDRYILEDVPCTTVDSTSMVMCNMYGTYLHPEDVLHTNMDDDRYYHALYSTDRNYKLGLYYGVRHYMALQKYLTSLWEHRLDKYLKTINI